jgi:quercetin dioxygenase-like cupin family protein
MAVNSFINPIIKSKYNENQLCAIVHKLWGREEWIVNNDKYCGKKLLFNKGFRFSLHFHKIKEESFYVLSGTIYLELIDQDVRSERVMNVGDVVHIKPFAHHRITAITDAEVMEFSTHHMEDDSYRLEQSSKVDLTTLILPL